MDIEVCIENVETGVIAGRYGADRVELCTALDLGGLTPSAGMIKYCVQNCSLQVFVMIRPKAGGFVYDRSQFEIMQQDIKTAAGSGAGGVVFGCLTPKNELDIEKNQILLSLAKSLGLGVTFHRAFDFLKDPYGGLKLLADMGFDRILTSGGKNTAIEGLETIKGLLDLNKNMEIMAGSGINAGNCREFVNAGVDAIHFTARTPVDIKTSLGMGSDYKPGAKKIKDIIKCIKD